PPSPSPLRLPHLSSNAPPSAQLYPLSLHDALPIYHRAAPLPRGLRHVRRALRSLALSVGPLKPRRRGRPRSAPSAHNRACPACRDRKSTRLNSSHGSISYAVFCLKKKNTKTRTDHT